MRTIPESMADCRVDARGYPVPFINIWTGEMPESAWTIRYDTVVGDLAIFTRDGAGVGVPDFTRQALQRQRRCMVRRLCQVCARPVDEGKAMLPVSSISTSTITVAGHGERIVISEPWLRPSCAEFAITVCPELVRRRRGEDLTLIVPKSWPELTISKGWIEGRQNRWTKERPVYMWAKAIVGEHVVVATVPA